MTADATGEAVTSRPRVLVVEDEMLVAFDVEDCLTELGYEVVGPFGEIGAARAAAAAPLDFALLDVNVADQKIYPVAEQLQARNIPFAFMSGGGASELARAWGDAPVLEKPFSRKDLEQVAKALRRGRKQP